MEIPMTRLCRVLGVPRSTVYHQPKVEKLHRPVDEALARTVHEIIQTHPTFGIRRVWAWLRYRLDQSANRKKIHRLMRIKGWTCRQRAVGKRPRAPGSKSIAPQPNQRWSTDIALVECGVDGHRFRVERRRIVVGVRGGGNERREQRAVIQLGLISEVHQLDPHVGALVHVDDIGADGAQSHALTVVRTGAHATSAMASSAGYVECLPWW